MSQKTGKISVRTSEESNTLCRLLADGTIEQMHSQVRLRADRGEFYNRKVKDVETDDYVYRKVITAQGYARLNNLIGATFATPPNIQVGDKVVGNPYFERDGASIKRVMVRRIGIARNAAGTLAATDLTLTYDLDDYLIGEIWDRWQPFRKSDKPKSWGRVVGNSNIKTEPHEKVIEVPGGVYLVVNISDPEVIKLWSAHLQRQKFAERNAVSICERNILKKFAAIAYANDDGTVAISHWTQPDRNVKQFEEIARRIQEGEVHIEGMKVQVETISESIDAKEAAEALVGEGEDAPDIEEEYIDETPAVNKDTVLAEIRAGWRKLTSKQHKTILDEFSFKTAADIGKCDNVARLEKLRTAVQGSISE